MQPFLHPVPAFALCSTCPIVSHTSGCTVHLYLCFKLAACTVHILPMLVHLLWGCDSQHLASGVQQMVIPHTTTAMHSLGNTRWRVAQPQTLPKYTCNVIVHSTQYTSLLFGASSTFFELFVGSLRAFLESFLVSWSRSSLPASVCVKVRFQLEQTREGLQRQLAATDGQMHVLQARLEDSQAEQQVHLCSQSCILHH